MKPSDILSEQEVEIIGECLAAAIHGPFFVDYDADDPWWEFDTLMGVSPKEMAEIAEWWPRVEVDEVQVQRAVNNVMNHLLGYPHRRWDVWSDYIPVSPQEILTILKKWRFQLNLTGGNSSNEYFNQIML